VNTQSVPGGLGRLDILAFSHIGFVVPSVREFRDSWGTLLGIGDWLEKEVELPAGRVQIHGEPVLVPTANVIAFAKFGGTSIEVIEPRHDDTGAARWLREHGPGMQHIGVWVEDLPTELAKLGGNYAVTYSPVSLIPELADRPASAMVEVDPSAPVRPPFWAYLETTSATAGWNLELLDAKFEWAYREAYGEYVFYPGDLPGSRPFTGEQQR
jgi:hypothetical protein